MRRMKDDRGVTAVFTAIVIVMLMGLTALAVDVGALWWDKKELQNGADAAALALAQSCAAGGCEADENAMAEQYADNNKTDSAVTVERIVRGVNFRTVDVVSERDFWFASVMGAGSSGSVRASATATWDVIGGASTLPLAVSECFLERLAIGETKRIFIKSSNDASDDEAECGGDPHYIPGGFGWLDANDDCEASTEVYNEDGTRAIYDGDPGNNAPCSQSQLLGLAGQTVLVPVFDQAEWQGNNGDFYVLGYAQFTISAYCFSPGNLTSGGGIAGPTSCTGSDRWLEGSFQEMVSLDAELGGGEDYGARTVQLTN
ncbi:pilus assembly protein TadG-related protein [Tessaracoccus oleiagri]|uniref:Flp pilus assembly protein TadG n=1 Tax=Tessaracoccus oleiagri TaxID=686624 RepID=A0A1G9JUW0_9ACTN|nr:pilus assembly protein TadG-related protein [Tessaracoccus oleiagri]SDL41046.1 Flp pilus assembly protein TadG [Tessaracoccus oleiagri]